MIFKKHNRSKACPVAQDDHVILRNNILVSADPYETRLIHSVPIQASHIKNWPKVQEYSVVKLSYDGLKLAQPDWSNL